MIAPKGSTITHLMRRAAAATVVLVGLSCNTADPRESTPVDAASAAVRVEVVGHRWWWEVQYVDDTGRHLFTTANELRVPVDRTVIVGITSRDVIHSFWVPSLHGKMDAIPGRVNYLSFRARKVGTLRGQCAEFCGLQHANMAMAVVGLSPSAYDEWAAGQRRPAREPQGEEARRGAELFSTSSCSMCHTVRGTGSWGRVAPDLTHVASRLTLAAGTLPNTVGHLAGWVRDPQAIKPGSHMPPTPLESTELQAIVGYLRTLE